MIKEKDGRKLGDRCDFLGEIWKLTKIDSEYYWVTRVTDITHSCEQEFHSNFNDCWLDAPRGGLVWHRKQYGRIIPKIKSWQLK